MTRDLVQAIPAFQIPEIALGEIPLIELFGKRHGMLFASEAVHEPTRSPALRGSVSSGS